LVRRDVISGIHSSSGDLILKLSEYYYNDGTSKELLCLSGTVACQYKGNRYNIPIEIWVQQDHPHVTPLAYVKPTPNMYVSAASNDVRPDGTIILPYLKNWRHVNIYLWILF
jgi:ESCRT-I complex subunit TSG101